MAALEDSTIYFKALNTISTQSDQLSIQAESPALISESIEDNNFVDRQAFLNNHIENQKYYIEESAKIAKLNDLISEGKQILSFLYSYRGCSRAIPQVQNMEQENRFEIYEKSYIVLKPQVDKMKGMVTFCEDAINTVITIAKALLPIRKDFFFSENFLFKMAEVMNLFFTLDTLKNMKTSLNNDFSMYKRVLTNMKKKEDQTRQDLDETAENQKLYMFLANFDCISRKLKDDLCKVDNHDELLVDLLNMAINRLEESQFFLPTTKHLLLKVKKV